MNAGDETAPRGTRRRSAFLLTPCSTTTGSATPSESTAPISPDVRVISVRFINLGVSLAQIGKPAEAAEAFQRAVQLDPANAMARRNLAILQEDRRSVR